MQNKEIPKGRLMEVIFGVGVPRELIVTFSPVIRGSFVAGAGGIREGQIEPAGLTVGVGRAPPRLKRDIKAFEARTAGRKYALNESFFQRMTPRVAYVLGFITTGCLYRDKRRGKYLICLGARRRKFVDKVREYLGTNYPILRVTDRRAGNKPHYVLIVPSKQLFESVVGIMTEERGGAAKEEERPNYIY